MYVFCSGGVSSFAVYVDFLGSESYGCVVYHSGGLSLIAVYVYHSGGLNKSYT